MAIDQIFSKTTSQQRERSRKTSRKWKFGKEITFQDQKMSTEVTRNYVNTPSVRHNFDMRRTRFENGGLGTIAYTTCLQFISLETDCFGQFLKSLSFPGQSFQFRTGKNQKL